MDYKNVIILVAMDSELQEIITRYSFQRKVLEKSSLEYFHIEIESKSILVCKSGIGPINASATLAVLLENFVCDLVLLLGLGGGLASHIATGDICIASEIIQHDAICTFDDRVEQMACGELHLSLKQDERANIKLSSSSSVNNLVSKYLKSKGHIVHTGIVLSGSEFNGSKIKKQKMVDRFSGSIMVEMESCAIAYLCNKRDISFSIIKTTADSISSRPDQEYCDFIKSNSQKAAHLLELLLGRNCE